jgi:hypothetical protein
MTTPFSADSGRGQEGDQEAYSDLDAATGVDSAFLIGTADIDSGLGADGQSFVIILLLVADMDSGIGYDDVTAPHTDTDASVGTESASLGLFIAADTGSGSEGIGPIGIWPFPPPWLFAVGGGFMLIWRPGTPEAREVRSFACLDSETIRYAKLIRDSADLLWPTDSDEGAGAEASLPTATIVQYAVGTLVTCGVPS